jgi:hypothetical protein
MVENGKGRETMKKLMLGILIGIMLSIPVTIFGEQVVSVIGKTIEGQYPIYVNGQKVEKDAIVVEGTSYLPVRLIGEIFGQDVSFIDSQVILKERKDALKINKEIEKWQEKIIENEQRIHDLTEKHPEKFPNSDMENDLKNSIVGYKAKIIELETQKAQLEATQ